jgi:hypothetical protein
MASCYEHSKEPAVFKMHGISWVAEQLSAGQEGSISAELVIQYMKCGHQTNKVHYIP